MQALHQSYYERHCKQEQTAERIRVHTDAGDEERIRAAAMKTAPATSNRLAANLFAAYQIRGFSKVALTRKPYRPFGRTFSHSSGNDSPIKMTPLAAWRINGVAIALSVSRSSSRSKHGRRSCRSEPNNPDLTIVFVLAGLVLDDFKHLLRWVSAGACPNQWEGYRAVALLASDAECAANVSANRLLGRTPEHVDACYVDDGPERQPASAGLDRAA